MFNKSSLWRTTHRRFAKSRHSHGYRQTKGLYIPHSFTVTGAARLYREKIKAPPMVT